MVHLGLCSGLAFRQNGDLVVKFSGSRTGLLATSVF